MTREKINQLTEKTRQYAALDSQQKAAAVADETPRSGDI